MTSAALVLPHCPPLLTDRDGGPQAAGTFLAQALADVICVRHANPVLLLDLFRMGRVPDMLTHRLATEQTLWFTVVGRLFDPYDAPTEPLRYGPPGWVLPSLRHSDFAFTMGRGPASTEDEDQDTRAHDWVYTVRVQADPTATLSPDGLGLWVTCLEDGNVRFEGSAADFLGWCHAASVD